MIGSGRAGGAAIALAAAALLACAAPLSRALAVDPARRLRCE